MFCSPYHQVGIHYLTHYYGTFNTSRFIEARDDDMKYYLKEKEYVNSILFQGIAEIFFYGSVIRVSEQGVGGRGRGGERVLKPTSSGARHGALSHDSEIMI